MFNRCFLRLSISKIYSRNFGFQSSFRNELNKNLGNSENYSKSKADLQNLITSAKQFRTCLKNSAKQSFTNSKAALLSYSSKFTFPKITRRKFIKTDFLNLNYSLNWLWSLKIFKKFTSVTNYISKIKKSKENNTKEVFLLIRYKNQLSKLIKEDIFKQKTYRKSYKNYGKEEAHVNEQDKSKIIPNKTTFTIQEVKQPETKQQKAVKNARDSQFYRDCMGYRRQLAKYAAKNEFIRKLLDKREAALNKIEDAREYYETTQNPIVQKFRDFSDQVLAPSNTSQALSKVVEHDKDFEIYEFLNEMKECILPSIITAQLESDMKFIKQTCVDNAYKGLFAYSKEREASTYRFESRIIDLSEVDFIDATIHNKKPIINVSCMCQQFETSYSKNKVDLTAKDQINDNSSTRHEMKNMFYKFSVRFDPDCHIFGQKFVDIQMQQVQSLSA